MGGHCSYICGPCVFPTLDVYTYGALARGVAARDSNTGAKFSGDNVYHVRGWRRGSSQVFFCDHFLSVHDMFLWQACY